MTQHDDYKGRRRARSVRLSARDTEVLLDELDRAEGDLPMKLIPPRYPYRIPDLHLDVRLHSGSAFVPYLVPTRWLSQGALGCLHGSFVHRGTLCRAVLITPYGTWHDQEGCVESCQHVDGHVHEFELRFLRKIDLSFFCLAAGTCRVLVVEDDRLTARMIGTWFTKLNAKVSHVEDGLAAIGQISKTRFDLVLLDLELPQAHGFQVARTVRQEGYSGRIVAMSSLGTPDVQRQSLDSGCDQFLAKPFGQAEVAELVNSLRKEPIVSAFHGDQAVAELITAFADELPNHTRAIWKALLTSDMKALHTAARCLKAQGGTCGFDPIAEAAAAIESAIVNGAPAGDIRRSVDQLVNLCARVRAPTV